MTLAPELVGADRVVEKLLECDVVVAAGHSAATYEQGRAALAAGVTHGTHLFNGMPPLDPRQPGLAGALLEDPAASVAIIVDGVHLHPATVGFVRRTKPPDRVVLITDAMAGMGVGPGEYSLHDLVVTVDGKTARNVDGGLAGSVLSLDEAVRNYVAFTGCSAEEAIHAASANPAQVIGETGLGRIEVANPADLVVLDDQLVVQATLVAGVPIYCVPGFADRLTRR